MSTGKKFILIVLDILLLSIMIPVTWDYYNALEYNNMTSSSSQFLYVGDYMPHYLFWASIILTILLILALLMVLFYPRTYVDFVLSTHGGKLTLKRSAIEGLVREKIIEYEFLKNPNIDITLHKNKIAVGIKGEIVPRVEITEKSKELEQEILDSLKLFFGIEQPLKVKIIVNAINKENNTKRSRVV